MILQCPVEFSTLGNSFIFWSQIFGLPARLAQQRETFLAVCEIQIDINRSIFSLGNEVIQLELYTLTWKRVKKILPESLKAF